MILGLIKICLGYNYIYAKIILSLLLCLNIASDRGHYNHSNDIAPVKAGPVIDNEEDSPLKSAVAISSIFNPAINARLSGVDVPLKAEGYSPPNVYKIPSGTPDNLVEDTIVGFARPETQINNEMYPVPANAGESAPVVKQPDTQASQVPNTTILLGGYPVVYDSQQVTDDTQVTGDTAVQQPATSAELSDNSQPTTSVVPLNNPPVLAAIGDKAIAEGNELSFTLSATDPDGDALTYSAEDLPEGSVFDSGTRAFTWTPGFTQAGGYPVTFTVSDGTLQANETITITVNAPQNADTNNNGIGDSWEIYYLGNLAHTNPNEDYDSDGLTNYEEYLIDVNPHSVVGSNPIVIDPSNDSDGDGFTNLRERDDPKMADPCDPGSYPGDGNIAVNPGAFWPDRTTISSNPASPDKWFPAGWVKHGTSNPTYVMSWGREDVSDSRYLKIENTSDTVCVLPNAEIAPSGWHQEIGFSTSPSEDDWYELTVKYRLKDRGFCFNLDGADGTKGSVYSNDAARISVDGNGRGGSSETARSYCMITDAKFLESSWSDTDGCYHDVDFYSDPGWKTQKVYTKIGPNATYVRISASMFPRGKIYFKNISLKKVDKDLNTPDFKRSGRIKFLKNAAGQDIFVIGALFQPIKQDGTYMPYSEIKAAGFNTTGIVTNISDAASAGLYGIWPLWDAPYLGRSPVTGDISRTFRMDVSQYTGLTGTMGHIDAVPITDPAKCPEVILIDGPDEPNLGLSSCGNPTALRELNFLKQKVQKRLKDILGREVPYMVNLAPVGPGVSDISLDAPYADLTDVVSFTWNNEISYSNSRDAARMPTVGRITRRWIDSTANANGGESKPLIAFGLGVYYWSTWDGGVIRRTNRVIPFHLQRFEVYSQIVNGAGSLYFYNGHMNFGTDPSSEINWNQIKEIAGEFSSLYNMYLTPDFYDEWNCSDGRIEAMLKKYDGKIYLIATNPSEHYAGANRDGNVTFTLSGITSIKKITALYEDADTIADYPFLYPGEGVAGEGGNYEANKEQVRKRGITDIVNAGRDIPINEDNISFTDKFIDYAVHVYEIEEGAVNNNPPVLAAIGDRSMAEGSTLSFTLSATDPDGDALTYSAEDLPEGSVFDSTTHTFTWMPGYDKAGIYSATFIVSDGISTVSEIINITINNVAYTINASAGAHGSIAPSGDVIIDAAADQTFTIIPDEGSRVQDILVDGVSQGPLTRYNFSGVLSDHTISATFTNASLTHDVYYVDATGGDDTNDGLTFGRAWKTMAKVNSMQFSPGDSILLKRGEVWREKLNIPSSGAPDNPITFGNYGSIDLPNPLLNGAILVTNWTDDGENIWMASSMAHPLQVFFNGIRGRFVNTIEDLSMQNDWTFTTSGEPFSSPGTVYVYSTKNPGLIYTNPGTEISYGGGWDTGVIYSSNKSYFIIDGIDTIYGKFNCISLISDKTIISGVIVKNLNASYAGGCGIVLTLNDVLVSNVHSFGNGPGTVISHNLPGHGIYPSGSDNFIIENSEFNDNAGYGIHDYRGNSGIIRNNKSHDNGHSGIVVANTPSNPDFTNVSVDVYNNICYSNGGSGIGMAVVNDGFNRARIFNNLFYDNTDYGIWVYGNDLANSIEIKNNILLDNKRALVVQNDTSIYDISNNLYYQDSGTLITWNGTHYSTSQFADYQAANPWDTNSICQDPLLVDPANNDFHLRQGSPLIDTGADAGLTKDFEGNPVPQDGNGDGSAEPDIGPYEAVL